MKVLHVCETMLGGVGTHQNELVSYEQKILGAENVAFLGPFEDLIQVPDIAPPSVHTFRRPSRLIGLPLMVLAFIRLTARFRPDIVHIHSTFAGALLRPIAWAMRKPIVYCPHGWAMDRYRSPLVRRSVAFVERSLGALTSLIVAVSESERQRGLEIGIPDSKIRVVFNGVREEPPAFDPVSWDDKRLRLLFVGRLDRQKGIDILMRAVAGLEDKACLRIIGDSVADGAPLSLAAFPHVFKLGWLKLPQVSAQIQACDAVVMPSRWEGLPMVALEAMRLGKPLIASRVGGIPEAVEDGETGRLFPCEDYGTLRQILFSLNRSRCEEMGRAGKKRFLRLFTVAQMGEGLLAAYRTIL